MICTREIFIIFPSCFGDWWIMRLSRLGHFSDTFCVTHFFDVCVGSGNYSLCFDDLNANHTVWC